MIFLSPRSYIYLNNAIMQSTGMEPLTLHNRKSVITSIVSNNIPYRKQFFARKYFCKFQNIYFQFSIVCAFHCCYIKWRFWMFRLLVSVRRRRNDRAVCHCNFFKSNWLGVLGKSSNIPICRSCLLIYVKKFRLVHCDTLTLHMTRCPLYCMRN